MVPMMHNGRWLLNGSASWSAGHDMAARDPEIGAELPLRGTMEDRRLPVRHTAAGYHVHGAPAHITRWIPV
jgi:hypothetical protein